jgi:hypothetical protein
MSINLESTVRTLAAAYPEHQEELRLAHADMRRDPRNSLTKCRMVLEALLVGMYRAEIGQEPRKPLLGELLKDNQFTGRFERRIVERMKSVHGLSNLGPHARPEVGPVEPADAETALDGLCVVLLWHRDRCHGPGAEPGANGDGEVQAPELVKAGVSSEAQGGGVVTDTDIAGIEIVIDRDFDSYTPEEQERLLRAIGTLLGVSGKVQVTSKHKGSVKLRLRLTHEQAERLLWAARGGDLAEFGVVDAKLIEPEAGGTPTPTGVVEPRAGRRTVVNCADDADSRGGLPRRFGGYELLAELGRGGFGVVYKARQVALKRVVALKMIQAGADDLARFMVEAESVARLQHPNIIQIHEIGEHDGLPYFSLEFCAGGSLAQRLNGAPLPAAEAAQLIETLARAMHTAHLQQVVHRDLKPANILLTADGRPKITDFGLAKKLDEGGGRTETGEVMGTPSYMAPEQAAGRLGEIGPATDVYALGALLYELLTGRAPFRAASPMETLQQVLSNDPVALSRLQPRTPRDLETICLKCLQKEPRKRYASALELADDLARFRGGESIRARPIGALSRVRRWCRRNRSMVSLLGALLVCMMVAVAVWLALR